MSTDLDLDALEREYEQQKTWGDEFQHLTDWKVVLPLIQRLREAEAALAENGRQRDYLRERLSRQETRIAQLERVREAARELRVAQKTGEDEIVSHGPKGSSTWFESLEARLDAALAAVEETNA